MKIAVITDTHWGARNDNGALMHQMTKFYQQTFFPTLEQRSIDTVLHLGDLVDRRKYINFVTAQTMDRVLFEPLRQRNITMHLILGNHDTYYKNTNETNGPAQLYKRNDNLHLYENLPAELDFDGCSVLMVPWINKQNQDAIFEALKDTRSQIVMGHFEIQGYEMMRGRLCEHGLDRNLFEKFDSVYSGHFHHPSAHGNVTYLGAPYEMDWSDYGGHRGFHIFDTETRQMEFVANPFSCFHKFDYADEDLTVDDIEAIDVSHLENTFIKVIVKERTQPYLFDMWLDKLTSSGASDVKVIEDHTTLEEFDDDDFIDEAQDTLTLMSVFIDRIGTSHDKDKVDQYLRELYQEAISI